MRIVLLGQTNIKSETATERNTIVNYRAFPKLESIFKKSIFVNIFLSRENFTNLKYSWKSDYQTYNDAYQPLFQNESKEEINSNHCLLKIDLYQILQISVCKIIGVILTKHYLHISILLLKAFVLCIVLQYYLFDLVLEDDKLPNY